MSARSSGVSKLMELENIVASSYLITVEASVFTAALAIRYGVDSVKPYVPHLNDAIARLSFLGEALVQPVCPCLLKLPNQVLEGFAESLTELGMQMRLQVYHDNTVAWGGAIAERLLSVGLHFISRGAELQRFASATDLSGYNLADVVTVNGHCLQFAQAVVDSLSAEALASGNILASFNGPGRIASLQRLITGGYNQMV